MMTLKLVVNNQEVERAGKPSNSLSREQIRLALSIRQLEQAMIFEWERLHGHYADLDLSDRELADQVLL